MAASCSPCLACIHSIPANTSLCSAAGISDHTLQMGRAWQVSALLQIRQLTNDTGAGKHEEASPGPPGGMATASVTNSLNFPGPNGPSDVNRLQNSNHTTPWPRITLPPIPALRPFHHSGKHHSTWIAPSFFTAVISVASPIRHIWGMCRECSLSQSTKATRSIQWLLNLRLLGSPHVVLLISSLFWYRPHIHIVLGFLW